MKIDDGVDIPAGKTARKSEYKETADKMGIGQSVLFPTVSKANNLLKHLKKLGRKGEIRKVPNGFRCWMSA